MSSSRRFSVGVIGIRQLELLVQQLRVGLDVPRLVHHLGGGVELGVDVRHLLHDLGGAHQRALLAVQELRELPRLQVAAQVRPLLVASGGPTPASRRWRPSRRAAPAGSPGRDPATSRCGCWRSTAGSCPSRRGSPGRRAPSSYSQRNVGVELARARPTRAAEPESRTDRLSSWRASSPSLRLLGAGCARCQRRESAAAAMRAPRRARCSVPQPSVSSICFAQRK